MYRGKWHNGHNHLLQCGSHLFSMTKVSFTSFLFFDIFSLSCCCQLWKSNFIHSYINQSMFDEAACPSSQILWVQNHKLSLDSLITANLINITHILTRPYIHTLKMLLVGFSRDRFNTIVLLLYFFVHWMGFVNNLLLLSLHIQYVIITQKLVFHVKSCMLHLFPLYGSAFWFWVTSHWKQRILMYICLGFSSTLVVAITFYFKRISFSFYKCN